MLYPLKSTKSHYYTTDTEATDWILGSLGVELSNRGYKVVYANELKGSENLAIELDIKNLNGQAGMFQSNKFSGVTFMCRGYFDGDFALSKNGYKVKEFNINNEADFPKYTDYSTLLECVHVALRDTLSQVLQKALPTIIETFEGR